MYSPSANEFFGSEFFVMTTNKEIRENFLDFARSIEQLAEAEALLVQNQKQTTSHHKVNGSILDRFRAVRNSTEQEKRLAPANHVPPTAVVSAKRSKSVIPSFLRRDN
jgi:hypothetical protein